jgi:hypothetical protein
MMQTIYLNDPKTQKKVKYGQIDTERSIFQHKLKKRKLSHREYGYYSLPRTVLQVLEKYHVETIATQDDSGRPITTYTSFWIGFGHEIVIGGRYFVYLPDYYFFEEGEDINKLPLKFQAHKS